MRSDHSSKAPSTRRLACGIRLAASMAAGVTLVAAGTILASRSPADTVDVAAAAPAEATSSVPQRGDAKPTTTMTAAPPSTTSTTSTTAVTAKRPFCDLLRSYTEQVRRISISLTDPSVVGPLLDETLPVITESAAAATGTAAEDVSTLREALSELKAGLERTDYDFAKLSPETALRLFSPEFMGSFARLDSLARKGC